MAIKLIPSTTELYDPASSTTTYQGFAASGTLTSVAQWQISRLTYNVGGELLAKEYADGDGNYDNIWDNRAALTYS